MKKLFALVAIAGLTFSLIGCAGEPAATTPAATPSAAPAEPMGETPAATPAEGTEAPATP